MAFPLDSRPALSTGAASSQCAGTQACQLPQHAGVTKDLLADDGQEMTDSRESVPCSSAWWQRKGSGGLSSDSSLARGCSGAL